jgi:hypothetical protein
VAAAALVLAVLALIVSGLSVAYTRRQTHTAEAADRRARHPLLVFSLYADTTERQEPDVLYGIRNDGPQDLDSITVHSPKTIDPFFDYPVACVGRDFGPEPAELGPLVLGDETAFLLHIGPGLSLPEFRVRVACRADRDCWEWLQPLDPPRDTWA